MQTRARSPGNTRRRRPITHALLAIGALLAGVGCEDTNLGCYRDLHADACRSRCRAGEQQACGALEHIEARAGDKAALERLCQRGDLDMCIGLANRQADPTQKLRILQEACARGDTGAPACAYLADITADPAEKRRILERACATPYGLIACYRLADLETDPAARAGRLAAVCIAGIEDACRRLPEVDPSPSSRRTLLLAACEKSPSDCAIHPIARSLELARAAGDAGGAQP